MIQTIKKLSDTIQRKFISIFNINDWQVETENGFEDIEAIGKTVKYQIYKIKLENGMSLKCADTHILINENHNEVFAKDSLGVNLITKKGISKVISVIPYNKSVHMYDLTMSEHTSHCYYTNGILSHNTTTYTVFALWLTTLFPEKRIMICANKLQTALEIMNRIRTAYEYLPQFIKPGVVSYNKGSIEFSNKSSIQAFSTSSSGARGSSANCVSGNTKIHIRLFKFLKFKIPIKWLKFLCKEETNNTIILNVD